MTNTCQIFTFTDQGQCNSSVTGHNEFEKVKVMVTKQKNIF